MHNHGELQKTQGAKFKYFPLISRQKEREWNEFDKHCNKVIQTIFQDGTNGVNSTEAVKETR